MSHLVEPEHAREPRRSALELRSRIPAYARLGMEAAHVEDAFRAIHDACIVRFRPIMMTTMAALFGTLPIALGYGAGAEARQPLGLAVVGGLLFSQMLTLFVTPVVYTYFDGFERWLAQRSWRVARSDVRPPATL
jgi:Cu/Ag efflux pump CusA